MVEKVSMSQALAEMLDRIGGPGKFQERDWRISSRLNWHTKAKSAVRHLLHGERKPTLEEAKQIEAAHFKWCAEQVKANRDANEQLFKSMREALDAMERTDAEFFGPHIEEMRQLIFQNRLPLRIAGGTDSEA